jgi:hypothetical protein
VPYQTGISTHWFWDRLLFNKIKQAMGLGHCRLVLSGSAPLSPHVLEFLRIVLAPATVSTRHSTASHLCLLLLLLSLLRLPLLMPLLLESSSSNWCACRASQCSGHTMCISMLHMILITILLLLLRYCCCCRYWKAMVRQRTVQVLLCSLVSHLVMLDHLLLTVKSNW